MKDIRHIMKDIQNRIKLLPNRDTGPFEWWWNLQTSSRTIDGHGIINEMENHATLMSVIRTIRWSDRMKPKA